MKKVILLGFVSVLLSMSMHGTIGTRLIITANALTTHHVYPGQSIQEAIDSAQSEDTIFVHTGTYYEHVTIDESISLIGEDKHNTIIDGNLTGTVMNVTANNVKITGFTIQRSYQFTPGYGVYVGAYSTNNNISYNIITNNERAILLVSSNNIIFRNNMTNNKSGIILGGSSNIISKNHIEKSHYSGVRIGYQSSDNLIIENNVTNNGDGVSLHDDWGSNTISGNNVINNTGPGLYLGYSGNNVFYDNNVINNECGVELHHSSNTGYNIFYRNNFIDNAKQVDSYESTNDWDDGYTHRGNYWSNYGGVDEKSGPYQDQPGSDGIGDTPYTIDSYNRDRYPLMNPWTPTLPTSYVIGVPIDLPTIQEAINVAGTGDTIFVYNGTYYERLHTRKPLLLIGEDPTTTIIDGGGEGSVISIGANNVVIQNFTIRNSGPDYSDVGISIDNYGRSVYYGNALIKGNIITKNGGWGIQFYYTSNNTVLENNIANNTNGIILYSSLNNTISRNNITNNQQNGIQFSESRSNNVSENDIENNGNFGVGFFTISSDNAIYRNNVENNKYGIYIKQASHNKIYHNNFINNINQAHIEPTQFVEYVSANTLDDGYPSGGNYWSNYIGVDSDYDGIGDTPYVIDENNQDNYPLMSPWGLEEVPQKEIPLPFWMQWWLWAIAAVVVIVLAGALNFLKKRKPPTLTAPILPTEGT